jgi:nitric oxide reductase subunit B
MVGGEDFRTNRYDKHTKTLTLSAQQAAAFRALVPYYSRFFSDPKTEHGLRPDAITDRTQLRQLTTFFAWTHGHAAMMGVYGMLALGLAMFCLRYLIPAERWPERWAKVSFWATNIGLAWMCFATLLPLGILQLYKSVNDGYFEARELKFLTNDTNAAIEWLRLPGDIVFIVGGAVPALYIGYLGIRHTVKQMTLEEPEDILFTEITEPAGVGRVGGDEATAARLT